MTGQQYTDAFLPALDMSSPQAPVANQGSDDDLSNVRSLYQTINEGKELKSQQPPGSDNLQHTLSILRAAQNHLKGGSVRGVYSSSGFDIVSLLYQVINRKNPQVDIGPVDLSCSFLVTDVSSEDNHIVYMSGAFEKLTGYPESYILNQNCRFLQNPQGAARTAEAGFTDAASVFALRKAITKGNEVQVPLLNYKRGGESFVNMVTCIPLYLDKTDIERVTHFIGFQMDLNQYPDAILQRMLNGSYTMNYRLSSIPRKPREIKAASPPVNSFDIMSTITSTDPLSTHELVQRFLYHTSADIIMTVSLKGQIVHVSPAIYAQLEYTPEEVVGLSLSDFIHPSDVTIVLRELREITEKKKLSTLFRVRTKRSGYIWMDANGQINNGYKRMTHCVVFTMRPRPVSGIPLKVVLDSYEKNIIDTKPNSEAINDDPHPSSSEGATAMGQFKRKKFSVLPKESIMPMDLWMRISHNGLVLYTARTAKYLYGYDSLFNTRLQSYIDDTGFDELMETVGSTRRITTAFFRLRNAAGFSVMSRAIIYPGEMFGGQMSDASIQLTPLPESSLAQIEKMNLSKTAQIAYKLGPCTESFSLYQDSIVGKRQEEEGQVPAPKRAPASVSSHSNNSAESAAAHVMSPPSASSADSDSFYKTHDANLLAVVGPSRVNGWQYEHNQLQVNNKKLAEQVRSKVIATS